MLVGMLVLSPRTKCKCADDNNDAELLHSFVGAIWRSLTNSSSATGHGDARRRLQKRRAAMACSLERVVRPAPTERTNVGQTWTPAGE